MLKLPFKTSPNPGLITIGNPQIGELELPKYGDFTPNERIYIKSTNLINIRSEAVKLSQKIATASNLKIIDVYNALVQNDGNLLSDFLQELIDFQDMVEENSRQKRFVYATAMLKRIIPEWEAENTQTPDQIHPQLVREIADFAMKEESGWIEIEEIEEIELTEEDLVGNSATPPNQTGEKSIGESEDTGLKSNGSRKKALATSQPG